MQLPKHTHGCEDVTVVILLVRNISQMCPWVYGPLFPFSFPATEE